MCFLHRGCQLQNHASSDFKNEEMKELIFEKLKGLTSGLAQYPRNLAHSHSVAKPLLAEKLQSGHLPPQPKNNLNSNILQSQRDFKETSLKTSKTLQRDFIESKFEANFIETMT